MGRPFAILSLALVGAVTLTVAGQDVGVHPISGRRYAQVMDAAGADWLDRPEREAEEAPDAALDAIGVRRGTTVADIGAGSGFMTERLADRVGSTGKVYANDIQPDMLGLLRARIARRHFTNVVPVLGSVDDPKLPPSVCDLELMVDVYHELSEPQTMLRHLRESLTPTGRLVLLEYRKEDPAIPIRPEHKMTIADAKLEVEHEGFHLATVSEVLPRQHILIFTKASESDAPPRR